MFLIIGLVLLITNIAVFLLRLPMKMRQFFLLLFVGVLLIFIDNWKIGLISVAFVVLVYYLRLKQSNLSTRCPNCGVRAFIIEAGGNEKEIEEARRMNAVTRWESTYKFGSARSEDSKTFFKCPGCNEYFTRATAYYHMMYYRDYNHDIDMSISHYRKIKKKYSSGFYDDILDKLGV